MATGPADIFAAEFLLAATDLPGPAVLTVEAPEVAALALGGGFDLSATDLETEFSRWSLEFFFSGCLATDAADFLEMMLIFSMEV